MRYSTLWTTLAAVLVTSCTSLTPEQREAYFGKMPSASECLATVSDYLSQNNLALVVPSSSKQRLPVITISTAFGEPTARPVRLHGEWTTATRIYLTNSCPPASATDVGYFVTVTYVWESPEGEEVGRCKCFLFIHSDGTRDMLDYQTEGKVWLVNKDELPGKRAKPSTRSGATHLRGMYHRMGRTGSKLGEDAP